MEYREIRLGDYIKDIASGPFGSNLKVECFVPFGFPIIDGANLMSTRVTDNITKFVTEEKARSLARSIAKRHDVIVTISGTLGQISYIPMNSKFQEYLCSQRQFRVTFDESLIDVEYLVYYFHTKQGQKKILSFANYVGVPALAQPLPNFKGITINIPPIDYQHKIASTIAKIDDKIALNTRLNAELEAMAKQLYDYWFVQFDFPDENGKPYKSSGGKMVYNSTLKRDIPAGWEVKRIEECVYPLERGMSYTSESIATKDGMPMINLACFTKQGNYRIGELKFYSGDYDQSYIVSQGDMLFACTDMTRDADIIGSPIIVNQEHDEFIYSSDLAKITPLNIEGSYLYFIMKDKTFHNYIKKFASGSLVLHLNLDGVRKYPFVVPPHSLQDKIALIVNEIIQQRDLLINELINLSQLRDSLLPMLMNGQVTVE